MNEAFVEHLATVGATALAVRGHDPHPCHGSLAPLSGDEPHVRYLVSVLGAASTSGRGRVASLDARRLRASR
jgi:hypothetical protein